MKPPSPKHWWLMDYDWSTYWTNGPSEIQEALQDPLPKPSPVKTLADMTAQEIEAIERQYQAQIVNRDRLPAFQ